MRISSTRRNAPQKRRQLPRPASLAFIAALLLSPLVGCTTPVRVTFEPEPQFTEQYSEAGCKIRYYRGKEHLVERCEYAGYVTVRDSGFSKDCGTDRIREEVRIAACRIGADSAFLWRRDNSMVTCIEEDADLYVCPPTDSPLEPAHP